MVRPKKGTPEGNKAIEKQRETMRKKYGDKVREYYQRIGKKGGSVPSTGGFAKDHDLAVRAGTKGGIISRRGKSQHEKLVQNDTTIRMMVNSGLPMTDIAANIGVPYQTVRKYIIEYIGK